MSENNKTLVIFQFETGDSSVPFYDVPAVIEGAPHLVYSTLSNLIERGISEVDGEDADYEDIAQSYLENLEAVSPKFTASLCCCGGIPCCSHLLTFQI